RALVSTLFPYPTLFRSREATFAAGPGIEYCDGSRPNALVDVRAGDHVGLHTVAGRAGLTALIPRSPPGNGDCQAKSDGRLRGHQDRKSTRLNSSHGSIS